MYIVRLPLMFAYFHLQLKNRCIALLIALLVVRYGAYSFTFDILRVLLIYLIYPSVMVRY